mmetsp:Transcript_8680/g.19875  ORF Transcript_8680/g.19875 Transcript_8680/m.19875 type:complete len:215 (+) Transcript_8680:429-1073(+)
MARQFAVELVEAELVLPVVESAGARSGRQLAERGESRHVQLLPAVLHVRQGEARGHQPVVLVAAHSVRAGAGARGAHAVDALADGIPFLVAVLDGTGATCVAVALRGETQRLQRGWCARSAVQGAHGDTEGRLLVWRPAAKLRAGREEGNACRESNGGQRGRRGRSSNPARQALARARHRSLLRGQKRLRERRCHAGGRGCARAGLRRELCGTP